MIPDSIKMRLKQIFLLILILGPGVSEKSIAQTFTTGHMTAEVIESVSASSQALLGLALETVINNTLKSGEVTITSNKVTFGVLTINSGDLITINVPEKLTVLSVTTGDGLFTELNTQKNITTANLNSTISPTGQISGTTVLADCQTQGLSQGSFTIILACN